MIKVNSHMKCVSHEFKLLPTSFSIFKYKLGHCLEYIWSQLSMYFNHALNFTAGNYTNLFCDSSGTYFTVNLFLTAMQCFSSWTNVAYFTTWNRCVEKLERTEISFYCSSSVHFINTGRKIPYPILATYSCGAARSL